VRSLQDHIAFIINIYQHNKFIQSVISTLKNAKYIQVVEILLVLIWAEDYNIQITNFCRITTCNDRRINRVHLTFSLYTKEFNTTAFIHLHIYDVYVNIILCRNLNIASTKLFPQSDLLRYQRV
jgi:methionine synthase II (cobalamin-independent)